MTSDEINTRIREVEGLAKRFSYLEAGRAQWEIAYQLAVLNERSEQIEQFKERMARMGDDLNQALAERSEPKRDAVGERDPKPDEILTADQWHRLYDGAIRQRDQLRRQLHQQSAERSEVERDAVGERDPKPAERPWMLPDWICPECQYTNYGVRCKCRNCNTSRPPEPRESSAEDLHG